MKNNRIIIFGGDGFVGWPNSLHLSKAGYDVTIVDNLVRRKTDIELGCESLTPIASIDKRIEAWGKVTGVKIRFECFDMRENYHRLLTLIKEIKPTAIVHFAEQRSAPFSMKSPYHKRYTVDNNINATNNVLCAVVESGLDIHVVHLGCYDDKTEILTEDGWKLFSDLTYDDLVATRDKDNRVMTYKKLDNIVSFDHVGKMYEVSGQRVDFCVTENHRVFDVNKYKPGILREKLPKDIEGKRPFFDSGFEFNGYSKDYFEILDYKIPAKVWVRFLGWYLSEGGLTYREDLGQYRVAIKQKIGTESDSILYGDLKSLIESIGLHLSVGKDGNCNVYSISNKPLSKFLLESFGNGSSNKFIPKEYRMLSKDLLEELLDTLLLGDGSIHSRGYKYSSISRKLIDGVQEVAIKCGWACCISTLKSETSYAGIIYVANISPQTMTSVDLHRYNRDKWIEYSGKVHCVTVGGDGIVFVRRNGKPVWSGNSTGYYGYSSVGMKIPEGYLKVKVDVEGKEKELEIMYPPSPGSIYHMTKCQDAISFFYYNKNDNVRITDLHQGIVWGTQTEETELDEVLINRFDYDGDYGTCLNRFLMQSAIGHPITVHGTGGQTRAFIHIRDTVKCVKMAIENPPGKGDKVKIFNQTSECLNVNDLALKIQKVSGAEIRYYKNPRNEDAKNDLKFVNEGFKSIGWQPILLDDGLMSEVEDIAKKYKDRCDESRIICTSVWDKNIEVDLKGSTKPIK